MVHARAGSEAKASWTGQYLTARSVCRTESDDHGPVAPSPGRPLQNLHGVDVDIPLGATHSGNRRVRLRQEHAVPAVIYRNLEAAQG